MFSLLSQDRQAYKKRTLLGNSFTYNRKNEFFKKDREEDKKRRTLLGGR